MHKFSQTEYDFILIHGFFVFFCVLLLLFPFPITIGVKLFMLVIIYNFLVSFIGFFRKDIVWIKLWIFVFAISLFQIFPDWFLAAELNILVFPEDGLFKIGTVSGYMLGLWAIPLFIISFIGLRLNEYYSDKWVYLAIAVLSLIIFGGAEASMWILNSWYPQNVTLIFDHIAIYILVPEIILGLSTFYLFTKVQTKKIWILVINSFIIMLLYLGSASFFYFLIEKIII